MSKVSSAHIKRNIRIPTTRLFGARNYRNKKFTNGIIDRQFIGGYDAFHYLKEIGKIQPGKTTCQYHSKENIPSEREE